MNAYHIVIQCTNKETKEKTKMKLVIESDEFAVEVMEGMLSLIGTIFTAQLSTTHDVICAGVLEGEP